LSESRFLHVNDIVGQLDNFIFQQQFRGEGEPDTKHLAVEDLVECVDTQKHARVGNSGCECEHTDKPKQAPVPATHFHSRLSFDGFGVVVEPYGQADAQRIHAVAAGVSILI